MIGNGFLVLIVDVGWVMIKGGKGVYYVYYDCYWMCVLVEIVIKLSDLFVYYCMICDGMVKLSYLVCSW